MKKVQQRKSVLLHALHQVRYDAGSKPSKKPQRIKTDKLTVHVGHARQQAPNQHAYYTYVPVELDPVSFVVKMPD